MSNVLKANVTLRNPKRGDIYFADLTGIEQSIGSEQRGKRPVLIIQNDIGNKYSPATIIAVITSKIKNNMSTHVIFTDRNILPQTSVICTEQIKTIDKLRLNDYRGNVGEKIMQKVDKAIEVSIGINKSLELLNKEKGRTMERNLIKKQTELDCIEHNWAKMVESQLMFFTNIEQYVTNLKCDQARLDKQIDEVLEFIECTNYNAPQGYKVYKLLKELRVERKEKVKEISVLEALLESFDCEKMRRKYQSGLAKMKNIVEQAETPPIINELLDIVV